VTPLDLGGLVLVASRTLGLDEDVVLELADLDAAESVLREVRSRCEHDRPVEAAAALLHGLVRRAVFGARSAEVAVMAALQLLALNGREVGDLGPPAQVRELLAGVAAGGVGVDELTAWLSDRTGSPSATRMGRLLARRAAAREQKEETMFERFTDRAREAVKLATEEARLLDHSRIGTEHILLGLLRVESGVAARVLEAKGIGADRIRADVLRIVPRGKGAPSGHIPFSPRAKKVLELSLREALRLRHNYIGSEHILLGLLREGEGVAAKVLAEAGLDFNDARQEVASVLSLMAAPGGGLPARQGLMDDVAALFDEVERLRAEVSRLRSLLREHGIEPDGGESRSA
jgi:Clp amino terminal domain, pathogenicity island component